MNMNSSRSLPVRVGAATLTLLFLLSTVACTVDQVLSDIETGLSIAGALVPAIGPVSVADAAAIQLLSGLGVTGLKDIQSDYDAWSKSGSTSDLQKLQATANNVKATLSSQLASLRISDPNAVAKANNWVNLITSSINAVLAAFPSNNVNPAELHASAAVAAIPTPESLKARWASEVCSGNAQCASLVNVHHARKHGRFMRAVTFGKLQ